MYKMMRTEEYDMTREVVLKNLDTGTEDTCFDYSDMAGANHKDFYFMEIGKKYDCKIKLFGDANPPEEEKTLCKVVRDNVAVGNGRLVEVSVDGDRYYIPRSDVEDQLKKGEFYYHVLRKDLIQVNNVIHGKYLD